MLMKDHRIIGSVLELMISWYLLFTMWRNRIFVCVYVYIHTYTPNVFPLL